MLGCGMTTTEKTSHGQASSVHHHDDGVTHNDSASLDTQSIHSEKGLDGHSDQGKCSVCASCCTGAVIVNIQSTFNLGVSSAVAIPFALQFFANHTPEGLDPPPRAFLA